MASSDNSGGYSALGRWGSIIVTLAVFALFLAFAIPVTEGILQ